MRKETIEFNEKQVENAKNDKELWKIVNELTEKKGDSQITLKEGNNV